MGAILRLLLVAVGSIGAWQWVRNLRQRPPYPSADALVIYPADPIATLRNEPDQIAITWQESAECVAIHAYTDPAEIPANPTATVSGVSEIVMPLPTPASRYYFRLSFDDQPPVHIAERIIPAEGIPNLRDIGGYRTREGRQIAWDRVYRAGSLARATESDLTWLAQRGVRWVCDLRTEEETQAEPDRLPANAQYIHHTARTVQDNRLQRLVQMWLDPSYLERLLLDLYTTILLDENAAVFGTVFRRLALPDEFPILIHCTAGKDRTGMTVALLLDVLDVPDEIIIADYSLSNLWFDELRAISQTIIQQLARFGVSEQASTPLFSAHPQTMRDALAYLRQHYGSARQYLIEQAGLDPATIDAVRENLLE